MFRDGADIVGGQLFIVHGIRYRWHKYSLTKDQKYKEIGILGDETTWQQNI